jgi:uncharacterized membrane protein
LIYVDNEWVPENLDDGHLDSYFFLLSGLMMLTIGYLYYISKDYEYKHAHELNLLEDENAEDAAMKGVVDESPLMDALHVQQEKMEN